MKYALVIGNDKYDDPKLAQLKTPAADSQALAKVLGNQNIGSFDEVVPLINKYETEIRRAVSTFLTNKKPDDLILLYFSGHGVLDDRGRLYLALMDTQISLLKATSIPATFITDEMDSCRSRRQILILDCCHSGAFARGTKGEQKAITETTFEGSGFGRVVLTASDSTQYALEGDQVISKTELSLFTHFLLEGLNTGEADTNNDGYVSLDEWYDYTYAKVISETPKQVPHKWSYNQQGDLIIAKNPKVRKKIVELPFELVQAIESPFTSIREGAMNELGKLLRSHDIELANLARLSLMKMKEDDSRRISSVAENLLLEFDNLHLPIAKLTGEPKVEITAQPFAIEEKPRLNLEKASKQPNIEKRSHKIPADVKPSQKAEAKNEVTKNKLLSSAEQRLIFNISFWIKWSGVTFLGFLISAAPILLLNSNWSYYFPYYPIPLMLAILAGSTSFMQWLFFRERLESWWIIVNIVAGLFIGIL